MIGLGQTIRQARKAKSWSLKAFSEKIGISIMTLQRIETGQVSPSVKLVVEIAHHLERPVTDFIHDKKRTMLRLKAPKIKTWSHGPAAYTAIFPEGIVDDDLGVLLLDLKADKEMDWSQEDHYKGFHLVDGSATLEFENKKVPLKSGQTVYFDARLKHRLVTPSGAKAVVVYRR